MPDLAELLKDERRNIMRLVTFGTADKMQAKIGESKSGKTYRRGGIKRKGRGKKAKDGLKALGFKADDNGYFTVGYAFHRASAPGEAPANDYGNLQPSIQPILIDELRGEINLADYGGVLEFGTDRAGRNKDTVIKPRPFIIPSLEETLLEL